MTREEAIKILSNRDGFGVPKGHTSGYAEAIGIAIRSLEAWDKFYGWLKGLQKQQEEIDGGVSVLTSIHLQPLIEMVEQIFGGIA